MPATTTTIIVIDNNNGGWIEAVHILWLILSIYDLIIRRKLFRPLRAMVMSMEMTAPNHCRKFLSAVTCHITYFNFYVMSCGVISSAFHWQNIWQWHSDKEFKLIFDAKGEFRRPNDEFCCWFENDVRDNEFAVNCGAKHTQYKRRKLNLWHF